MWPLHFNAVLLISYFTVVIELSMNLKNITTKNQIS